MIIASKILMRAKESQTSIPFSVLIIELCRWAKDQAKKGQNAASVDPPQVVDTDSIPAKVYLPTLAHWPSGTSTATPSDVPSSSAAALPPRPAVGAVSRSPITQSTDISMIFGMMEIPDGPEMPPATIEDEGRVQEAADPEFEEETDEDMLEVAKEASYEGLPETEETMVNVVVHASLANTPLVDHSTVVVPSEVTPRCPSPIDAPRCPQMEAIA
ncbi:hypothetical protein H5410_004923 [Solanum commersonii]|uniref:Polyprotein protein n=1 Tax=Solanum commersonii TaxID=4109 RepID=A0A9J6A575_SOLCO|nr:hypothetical protein H5410_004923 [Solanum commersonii]